MRAPITTRIRPRAVALALLALLAAAPRRSAHQGNPHYLSQVDDDHAAHRRRDGRRAQPRRPAAAAQHERQGRRRSRATTTSRTRVCSPTARSRSTRTRRRTTSTTTASAEVDVPAGVDSNGPPRWKEVDKTGRFEWHDHRFALDGTDAPAAGQGRVGQDQGLRLEGPDRDRRAAGRDRRHAVLDAAARRRRRRSARSSLGAAFLIACCIAVAVVRYRRRTAAERPAQEAEAW